MIKGNLICLFIAGSKRLSSLCCGSQHVWAVDSEGEIYFRVGTAPPSEDIMVPVWISVDGTTSTHDSHFVNVMCNNSDTLVNIFMHMLA